MAGWSNFSNTSGSYKNVEIELFDECEERLKILFEQALLVFLEEEGSSSNRPLPAVIGEGETVDLFKLFVLVREREGFDSVSRKGLWDSVAEQLGFDCSVTPSLRLVYSKYLDRMEKWAVGKSRIVNWDHQDGRKKGCYEGLLHELKDGFNGLLENGKCGKRNRATVFGCKHVEESCSVSHRRKKRFIECDLDDDDDDDDDDEELGLSCVVISDESEEDDSENEETLRGMLKWLTSVARCPHNPSIGSNECWIQVTRAKKALLVQRDNAELRFQNSTLLGHQTVHPSMYEDDRRSTGRLRYSIRRPHSSSSYNGRLVSLSETRSNNCRALVTSCNSTTPERRDLTAGTSGAMDIQVYSNAITKPNKSEIQRSYVSVGRHFQALVDEWSVSGLDSDTKWLGTCIWPLENEEALDDTIGKGRQDCCSCDILIAGSVECIRFHIAEKRMELKRGLGDVFFHWRFNQMGEEVSLRWTEREEKRFKELMISDSERFWENAAKCFRGKKREQLVSYYFNVFLINRRRYQNRVTPRHVDSDDEGAFGSVGNSFGRAAVTPCGSDIIICSQNSQCNDFD